MAGMSKNQLLAWLRENPQTMNWGAILAFNRADTNTVLLQDYINRFSTTTYLDPVQGFVKDSSTVGQYISDYVLDYPRLSFEIANVAEEIPSARLTLKVVGGTQVTFEDVPGGKVATRIEVVDPLNGPELTLNLQLVDVPGTVNSAGQVVLDLKKSSDFSLSYSDFDHERKLGGTFFKELFETLPDPKRVLVISEITREATNPIKPHVIKIRTQAAPGAKLRSADNYGDGAVLVLVAMQGEGNGGNPSADFPYLIPDDTATDYSATIILSNKLLMDKMIGQALKDAGTPGSSYLLESDAFKFVTVRGESGSIDLPIARYTFGTFECAVVNRALQFGDINYATTTLRLKVADDGIKMEWQGGSRDNFIAKDAKGINYYGLILYEWQFTASCQYVVNKGTQMVEVGAMELTSFTDDMTSQPPSDDVSTALFPFIKPPLMDLYREDVEASYPLLLSRLPAINVFVLKNLLFSDGNSVVLDEVALPGDMAIFGRIGPSLTQFAITPIQPLMGTGETLQFTTEPAATSGLTWTVEHILGGTGDKGSISTAGLYTAPAAVSGAFLRVKVIANGEGGYSSSALVSVVVNDITLSPVIQICGSEHTRTLSAGKKGTGTLTWSLKNPANGGKLVAGQNGQYVYTAPPLAKEGDAAFVVDEVVVKNELTNKTKSAYVMAVLADMTLGVQKDSTVSLPANQVKLKVKSATSVIPDASLTWETVAGSGTVANGIYTQPNLLDQRFALLVASWAPAPDVMPDLVFQGYILLPLPLFDAPETLVAGLNFKPV